MLLKHFSTFLPLIVACMGAPTEPDVRKQVEDALEIYKANTVAALHTSNSCNAKTVSIRRAWDDLSYNQRVEYITAVKCLEKLPTRLSTAKVPGARNWRDDFTYAHINQTNYIHNSALLLPWHRQYIWSYEQTLRNQCGYTGYLPYWAWERHTDNQSAAPIWGSGPDSFGNNGAYIPHGPVAATTVGMADPVTLVTAPGTGGGCISEGPFKDTIVNLGPVALSPKPNNDVWGLDYNPRCLDRDWCQAVSSANLTYTTMANLFGKTSIHDFHPLIEQTAHPMAHNYIGGNAVDLYASPNEPVFFLLHAQVDRVWSVWQGGDYNSYTRRWGLDGTVTMMNHPPSQNGTLDTVMHMGLAGGGDMPVRRAMSTISEDYCYMYL